MPNERLQMDESFRLPERAIRAQAETDNMRPELRACVHEFGYAVVKACEFAGVKDPRKIRQLVYEIWMGARQPAQRNRIGRQRTPVQDSIDWLLIQAGAGVTAATLVRLLWHSGMVILPREPGTVMVEASKAEVSEFNERITKTDKHKRRLRAAIDAQARRLWPHLFDGP